MVAKRDKANSAKPLVVVESPTKARTMKRFLGDAYNIKASLGHVRDLPRNKLGIATDKSFEADYVVTNKDVVADIRRSAQSAGEVYLATDPDREGEAISWHILEAIGAANSSMKVERVVFHEITKMAVRKAFDHPRTIDMNLVNAQQARRALDRLVGYKLSPVLWGKVRRGLSAGRVQSVALRLIVDREAQIEAFNSEEYWNIFAVLEADGKPFRAKLVSKRAKGGKSDISSKEMADGILEELRASKFAVAELTEKLARRRPMPPFITSTLQQEASRQLHMNGKTTMRVAQKLYEGVSLGAQGQTGLISYMRTDSLTLSEAALKEAEEFIRKMYGDKYSDGPRRYKTKSRAAQEAHEAIRPTSIKRTPESLSGSLSRDELRLYELIWKRTVASQMTDALSDETVVEVEANSPKAKHLLRARGSILKFDGYRRLYGAEQGAARKPSDREKESDEALNRELPPLKQGQPLKLGDEGASGEQKFTQPPPRYSEAMLIHALEEHGIGRPSTYSSIVGTIETREYVLRESSRFVPTALGKAVSNFLVKNFPQIMDVAFTARMEEELDAVAAGKMEWVPMLHNFYAPFLKLVGSASSMERVSPTELDEDTGEVCEKCERPMVLKTGRFGKFLGCSGYPECKNIRSIIETTGLACPKCGEGELIKRLSRRGVTFYGCNRYPDCNFATSLVPRKEPCPKCGWVVGRLPRGKRPPTLCSHEECDWGKDQLLPNRNKDAKGAAASKGKKPPARAKGKTGGA